MPEVAHRQFVFTIPKRLTGDNRLGRFPETASDDLVAGPKRNFQIFDPLSRACGMAEVTQHIPEKGAEASGKWSVVRSGGEESLASGRKQACKRWACLRAATHRQAALIKQVYKVDPLSCPKCGAEMKTCPP